MDVAKAIAVALTLLQAACMSTGIAFGRASATSMPCTEANAEAHVTAVAVSAEECDYPAHVATLSVEPGYWLPSSQRACFESHSSSGARSLAGLWQ